MEFRQKEYPVEVFRHAQLHENQPRGSGAMHFFHSRITVRRRLMMSFENWISCCRSLFLVSPKTEVETIIFTLLKTRFYDSGSFDHLDRMIAQTRAFASVLQLGMETSCNY